MLDDKLEYPENSFLQKGGLTADEVTYNNTTSGLTADNVQEAIDDLETSKQNTLTIDDYNQAVGFLGDIVSNKNIRTTPYGTRIDLPISATINSWQNPILTEDDGNFTSSVNSSTAWRVFSKTTVRWETTSALPAFIQYDFDTEQETNCIFLRGARYPTEGSIELKIEDQWVKVADFTEADYEPFGGQGQANNFPFDDVYLDGNNGRYFFIFPKLISHRGIRLNITAHHTMGNSWIQDLFLFNCTFVYRKMLDIKQDYRKQYVQFYDAELDKMVTVNQSFSDRWRTLIQVASSTTINPVVMGSHYAVYTPNTVNFELPNRGQVYLGAYSPKFKITNNNTGSNIRIRSSFGTVRLVINGTELPRWTYFNIPPYTSVTITRMSPGTTVGQEHWLIEFANTPPDYSGYIPTTSSDWNTDPNNVKDALDELAARIKALE